MRYIETDGETYDVLRCLECPCYDGGDSVREMCKHPKGDGISAVDGGILTWMQDKYGPHCPLREREAKP